MMSSLEIDLSRALERLPRGLRFISRLTVRAEDPTELSFDSVPNQSDRHTAEREQCDYVANRIDHRFLLLLRPLYEKTITWSTVRLFAIRE
jgi:hypothetical protein